MYTWIRRCEAIHTVLPLQRNAQKTIRGALSVTLALLVRLVIAVLLALAAEEREEHADGVCAVRGDMIVVVRSRIRMGTRER